MNCRIVAWLASAVLTVCAATAHAQAAPISRSARFLGNINFVATGGSLRTSASSTCAVGTSNTAAVSGIP